MATEEGSAIESTNGTHEDALASLVAATISSDTAPVAPDHVLNSIPPPVITVEYLLYRLTTTTSHFLRYLQIQATGNCACVLQAYHGY